MPVDVQIATDSPVPDCASIAAWASRALQHVPRDRRSAGGGDVCVRVVDEAESRRLNRDYRCRDAPTNVLSFPTGIDLPDVLIWGDVVVCAPLVRLEAEAQGKDYQDHFAHLVVHGVLHLLEYDHQTAEDAAEMERLEIEILGRCGVSDPYGEG